MSLEMPTGIGDAFLLNRAAEVLNDMSPGRKVRDGAENTTVKAGNYLGGLLEKINTSHSKEYSAWKLFHIPGDIISYGKCQEEIRKAQSCVDVLGRASLRENVAAADLKPSVKYLNDLSSRVRSHFNHESDKFYEATE